MSSEDTESSFQTPHQERKKRKTRRERAIEDGYDAGNVPLPPPYPIDEALQDAHEPDPFNDEKTEILDRCQPDPPPKQPPTSPTLVIHETWDDDQQEEQLLPGKPAATATEQPATATGNSASGAQHSGKQAASAAASDDALQIPARRPADTEGLARTRKHAVPTEEMPPTEPPESLDALLQTLQQWKARYVLALMEYGGIKALALRKCNVSRQSVEHAMETDAAFARLAADAVEHSTDLVEAACFRGATVGDTQPIYQGGLLVGYKRVRNTKDAELLLKLRGKIDGDTEEKGRKAAVTAVAPEAVGAIVASTMANLFAARQRMQQPVSPP